MKIQVFSGDMPEEAWIFFGLGKICINEDFIEMLLTNKENCTIVLLT